MEKTVEGQKFSKFGQELILSYGLAERKGLFWCTDNTAGAPRNLPSQVWYPIVFFSLVSLAGRFAQLRYRGRESNPHGVARPGNSSYDYTEWPEVSEAPG